MNNYENILPLAEVKRYLRLDPDYDDENDDIGRMINSAFGYIEKQTNHIFRVQDKTYNSLYVDGCYNDINVFDYPVNTTTFPEDVHPLYYSGFIKFVGNASVTLNVGYSSRADAPDDLIQCALQMIEVFYYGAEKNENTTLLPQSVKQIIDTNRRFIAV